MLVRFVEKLLGATREAGVKTRAAVCSDPVSDWHGHHVVDFTKRLAHQARDDLMGLGASPCPFGAYSLAVDVAIRTADLREALVMAFRTLSMITGAVRLKLVEDSRQATIEIVETPSARDPEHAVADWNMIIWHKLSQWLIGAEIWLDRAEFDHPLDTSYSGYATMFGYDCVFNSTASRLVFARSNLDRHVIRTPAEAEVLKTNPPGYFSRPVGLAKTWKQRIRDALRAEIVRGNAPPTIEDLAKVLGVSSQTLRRRLKAEEISYRMLKAEVRREMAADALANQRTTLSQASIAAGFAETNALSRALKSSRGISGRQFRDRVKGWRKSAAQ
jgi:AraC-like DNA-binding protein